jgi:hypothetical protein
MYHNGFIIFIAEKENKKIKHTEHTPTIMEFCEKVPNSAPPSEPGFYRNFPHIKMHWTHSYNLSYYYQAKPKLEPSCPLATIVNCRTASRIRRIDREPLAEPSEMASVK